MNLLHKPASVYRRLISRLSNSAGAPERESRPIFSQINGITWRVWFIYYVNLCKLLWRERKRKRERERKKNICVGDFVAPSNNIPVIWSDKLKWPPILGYYQRHRCCCCRRQRWWPNSSRYFTRNGHKKKNKLNVAGTINTCPLITRNY